MYVFLDIDGVLNKKEQWNRMHYLDKECIKNFCDFVNKISREDVYIILTSSWRRGFITTNNKNNSPQIRQLEQMLGEYGVTIRSKTPLNRGAKRDKEIEKYLEFVGDEVKYIIIDDDRMEFDKIRELNYFTNAIYGFTRADIKGCLKLLL